jgi:hypothetical protein
VTGHSLGGALAVIAAVFIYHEVLHQKETTAGLFLFTMGEPRVGDPDFASHIDRVVRWFPLNSSVRQWKRFSGVWATNSISGFQNFITKSRKIAY